MHETKAPRPALTDRPPRRPASALIYSVIGAGLWAVSLYWTREQWDLALLLFGALVLCAPALGFVQRELPPRAQWLGRAIGRVHFAGAALLAIALAGVAADVPVPTSWAVVPWLAFTLACGALGAWRVLALGVRRPGVFADAGLIFFAGSGVWTASFVLDWGIMGFPAVWARLTAAHQLVAGLILQVVASRVVAARPVKAAWIAAAAITVFNPLIAAGITIRHEGGPAWPEVSAAMVYACAVIVLGWVQLFHALAPSSRLRWLPRVLLVIADLSVGTAMTLAIIYAWGTWRGYPTLSIPEMIFWHANLNVYGFGLCGLAGWWLAARDAR